MGGEGGDGAATAIWAKVTGALPRPIVNCRTAADVQSAIRAARDCHLPLSVRGGGHDWAGRALCEGLVIDLRAMNAVTFGPDRPARVAGAARAAVVAAAPGTPCLATIHAVVG